MILRRLALRQGRTALPKSATQAWKRAFASEIQTNAKPVNPTFQDQQHVEGGIGGDKSAAVRSLETRQNPVGLQDPDVARDYHEFEEHKKRTQHIGSTLAPYYQPHTLLSNPPSPADITIELLLASQSHLGHAAPLWNPANARYIYGIRDGIHIISLDVTASHLRRASAIVRGVTERGGLVLFVGTRKGQDRAVVKAAEMAGACHLFDRWIPGSLTNGQQILGRCSVKVVDHMDREIPGFGEQLSKKGTLKPDLVVCLNPLENYVLLHECALNNIPTIGVIDTDANPTWVTYPIPANDDSLRCIQVIAGVLGRAGQEGQQLRLSGAEGGVVTYTTNHGLTEPPRAGEPSEAERAAETSIAEAESQAEDSLQAEQTQAASDEATEAKTEEDSDLAKLVAIKRRELNEPLTEGDRKILSGLTKEDRTRLGRSR